MTRTQQKNYIERNDTTEMLEKTASTQTRRERGRLGKGGGEGEGIRFKEEDVTGKKRKLAERRYTRQTPDCKTTSHQMPCLAEGGAGFFLSCQDFGRMFDSLFPACAFFFVSGDQLAQTNSTH